MILADTSILIEFARKPTLPVARVVVSGRPAVCGVVVAEMYTGDRGGAQRADVEATLRLFGRVPIDDPVWELTGHILGTMARRGTKIKFPDAVIAATAIFHKLPLWTRDAHFAWVQTAFPELTLYNETDG